MKIETVYQNGKVAAIAVYDEKEEEPRDYHTIVYDYGTQVDAIMHSRTELYKYLDFCLGDRCWITIPSPSFKEFYNHDYR